MLEIHKMKKKEILEKAINGGWGIFPNLFDNKEEILDFMLNDYDAPCMGLVIFEHSFAKAYWGDKHYYDSEQYKIYEWQGQLQQMVLEEDRIKYLEKFL